MVAVEGDGLRSYLNKGGAFHAVKLALLEKDEIGFWRRRRQGEFEAILSAGYGIRVFRYRSHLSVDNRVLDDHVAKATA